MIDLVNDQRCHRVHHGRHKGQLRLCRTAHVLAPGLGGGDRRGELRRRGDQREHPPAAPRRLRLEPRVRLHVGIPDLRPRTGTGAHPSTRALPRRDSSSAPSTSCPTRYPLSSAFLIWQGLLNTQFGQVNDLLAVFSLGPVPWLTDPFWAKVAVLLVNTWLGFPYMLLISMGALTAIPAELQEAARVDGASAFGVFRRITFPLLMVALAPLLIGSFAFNFNNFAHHLLPDQRRAPDPRRGRPGRLPPTSSSPSRSTSSWRAVAAISSASVRPSPCSSS